MFLLAIEFLTNVDSFYVCCFLQAIKAIEAQEFDQIPLRPKGGLRGESLPPLTITEEEFSFHDENRHLVTTADVTLVNNCGFKASIGIIYYRTTGKVYVWPTIPEGTTYKLTKVSQSIIYLYGRDVDNPSKLVWGTTKSKHCIGKNRCLEPKSVGSLSRSNIRVKLCGTGSSPTRAPTSKPVDAPDLTELDADWVGGHNTRRTKYFSENGLGPKNLKWSNGVKNSAQAYANKLIDIQGDVKCVIQHGYLGDDYGGENIHTNWGRTVTTVSATPDKVLGRWFDDEIDAGYGKNLHATQVVFRSTAYVGCGRASKTLYHGGKCYINVCRYISPGNCNMSPGGWKERVLDDNAQCGPVCPPEGCF